MLPASQSRGPLSMVAGHHFSAVISTRSQAELIAGQAERIRLQTEQVRAQAELHRLLTEQIQVLTARGGRPGTAVGCGLVELVPTAVLGRPVGQGTRQAAVGAAAVKSQARQAARRSRGAPFPVRHTRPGRADRTANLPGLLRPAGRFDIDGRRTAAGRPCRR